MPALLPRDEAIGQGRAAHRAMAGAAAAGHLAEADAAGALDPADLQLLAEATYLVGNEGDAIKLWIRTHRAFLAAGAKSAAARCAFWIGLILELRGDQAQAGGWIARAERLADEAGDCVEIGYMQFYAGMGQLETGDVAGAADPGQGGRHRRALRRRRPAGFHPHGQRPDCDVARQPGRRSGAARRGHGVGDRRRGVRRRRRHRLLRTDRAACHDVFDLRRGSEWTEALSGWCAHYQRGEVHRLRGELAEAEAAVRQAADLDKSPQPGLCLLRLAEGDVQSAAAARRLLGETAEPPFRARLLAAMVQVLLADGDVAAARAAADELAGFGAAFDSPLLRATAGSAAGAVLLAEGNARGACETLRRTADAWRALDVPYELARTRALLGVASAQLGGADGAAMEFDGARRALTALGAGPALRVADELAGGGPGGAARWARLRGPGRPRDSLSTVHCGVSAARGNRGATQPCATGFTFD